MKCSNCEHPLIPGARFCGKCGTPAPEANSKSEADKSEKVSRRIAIISDIGPVTKTDEADDVPGVPEVTDATPLPEDAAVTAPEPLPILAAPKPQHLLEGPHPALVKAQLAQREQKAEAESVPEAPADEPAEEMDATDSFLEEHYDDEYEVSVIDPPQHNHTHRVPPELPVEALADDETNDYVTEPAIPAEEPAETEAPIHTPPSHPDIPGPRYPFGAQMSDKNYFTAFLLSFFLGVFGIDRFYTGQYAYGVLKLCTFGGLTVLSYIDSVLLLANLRRDRYGRRLWGRDKDFRTSLWIFVGFTALSLVVLGIAIAKLPVDLTSVAP